MKKYKLLSDIMLSFLSERGTQRDYILGPIDIGWLEYDGTTIWYVNISGRFESITTPNLIDIALKSGKIEEIV